MLRKKIVKEDQTQSADVQYQNKIAQLVSLVGARKTYVELGRGSAKTTDIQVERLIDIMYEMPGAPVAWIADTFTNLQANVLPSVIEGLERKGLKEGKHYVIEKAPPEFSEKEKENLPDWLRPTFWKPFNHLVSYKRTMIFYTGLNITFGSVDRPSTLAGRSYVFIFGDEAKYLKPEQIANLRKAVRGYRAQYGSSPFYRGVSFTSDVADTSHVGEYDWMKNEAANVDKEAILLVIKAGCCYNDLLRKAVGEKDYYLRTKDPKSIRLYQEKLKQAEKWRALWIKARLAPGADTFYFRASSYVNADILTADWFADAYAAGLGDTKTAVLSMKSTLESGDRFYANLAERHFYFDGIDEDAYDQLPMRTSEDCTVLRYLDRTRPLELGVDFGNMCSMCVAQRRREDQRSNRETLRVLKFIYTLAPEYVDDLGRKFREYFAPMTNHVIYLYYDRAGNSYQQVGKDQVSALKKAIEFDGVKRTGWVVHLMNLRQGDIRQSEEYNFMQNILAETNSRLPLIRIDAHAAKNLKLSLEMARTTVKQGIVYKNKSSEKLPIAELPTRSTNPSDSFKYLLMRPDYRDVVKGQTAVAAGNLDLNVR